MQGKALNVSQGKHPNAQTVVLGAKPGAFTNCRFSVSMTTVVAGGAASVQQLVKGKVMTTQQLLGGNFRPTLLQGGKPGGVQVVNKPGGVQVVKAILQPTGGATTTQQQSAILVSQSGNVSSAGNQMNVNNQQQQVFARVISQSTSEAVVTSTVTQSSDADVSDNQGQ